MVLLTFLFRDPSDTSQVKPFPVFHSVLGTRSWLVTPTRPSAATLVSVVDGAFCWDSESHLIWGLNPHPEHTSVCDPDSSLGSRRSSTDGSTEWEMDQCITESIYDRFIKCKTTSYQLSLRERRIIPLTRNIANGSWLGFGAGDAEIHCAGETSGIIPVVLGDSEVFTDWMRAWGFRKINKLFIRDVNIVGLKSDVDITGGELCDVTFKHSSVAFQYIWEKSPDLHWWMCNWRPWRIITRNKANVLF